ncbi:single-stranded DNA-binding protein [Maribacter polysaccharolyticus]|uniref:single-stranded DNA-binding protein n=1 Tax=Maribacter polysaccharolyticus TaxID=3020831 RepID=UPI00237F4B98|nr:single-stranded DNA-binding protein [Maribacter polysaccharolyticus]MDE3744051.1 single-stranded DNA-binding protein [Maribacter polysaccharolyticus]
MKNLRNTVRLIGHIGQEPELKELESKKKVLNFSLATNEAFTNEKGEKINNTSWHRLVAWGRTAELLDGLTHSGSHVAIEGKLTYRTWEDKEGKKNRECEILVDTFLLLDSKSE